MFLEEFQNQPVYSHLYYVVDLIKDADIVVTNKNVLFEEQLKGLNKLKLICLTATGLIQINPYLFPMYLFAIQQYSLLFYQNILIHPF